MNDIHEITVDGNTITWFKGSKDQLKQNICGMSSIQQQQSQVPVQTQPPIQTPESTPAPAKVPIEGGSKRKKSLKKSRRRKKYKKSRKKRSKTRRRSNRSKHHNR